MKTSIQTFKNRIDVMVDNNSNRDNKVPSSNDSEGSLKKRKHEVTENDISALTDSTTNNLSDILPLAFNLFKKLTLNHNESKRFYVHGDSKSKHRFYCSRWSIIY